MSNSVSNINALIIISVIVNSLVTLSLLFNPDFTGQFLLISVMTTGSFVLLSLVGVFLMSTEKHELGSILAMIGFAIFVPVGLIGVIGVRKISDARARSEAGVS